MFAPSLTVPSAAVSLQLPAPSSPAVPMSLCASAPAVMATPAASSPSARLTARLQSIVFHLLALDAGRQDGLVARTLSRLVVVDGGMLGAAALGLADVTHFLADPARRRLADRVFGMRVVHVARVATAERHKKIMKKR